MRPKSTIEKGNTFRDTVNSMLEAAGFSARSEVREGFKKADIVWLREDLDGPKRYAVEAKDYSSNLQKSECLEFVVEYGTLVENGKIDSAWLISRGDISADGRALISAKRGLAVFTFAEFQRRLLGLDGYLRDMLQRYDQSRVENWYVPLHTEEDVDLENLLFQWLSSESALPLAIIAGYGKGKSTFAQHFCSSLAQKALNDFSQRAPILIPLGDIMDEQSLEGLLGKVFTSTNRVINYNFELFEKLNSAGRFVIFFDGFDEMKHGMTFEKFEGMVRELLRFDSGRSKLVILGRDTAFHDQHEFRAIIEGKQLTSGGFEVPTMGRRKFTPVTIRDFSLDEAHAFVEKLFPALVIEANKGMEQPSNLWIEGRLEELKSRDFDELIVRPVHALMLCQIATNPDTELSIISKFGLFDRFVHFLLDREVNKRGRDARFGIEVRRKFNAAVALWLWRHSGASTVSLSSIPAGLFSDAASGVQHNYNDLSLRRELTQGCLIDKNGTTVFFGHRSLQEFLVASAIIEMSAKADFDSSKLLGCLRLLNDEVGNFLLGGYRESQKVRNALDAWLPALTGMHHCKISLVAMRVLTSLCDETRARNPNRFAALPWDDPWLQWIMFFSAKGTVSFVAHESSLATLADILGGALHGTIEQQAVAMTLFGNVLLSSDTNLRGMFSYWLRPDMFEEAVERTRSAGNTSLVYFKKGENFLFWLFLKCAYVERRGGDLAIVVLPDLMVDAASTECPIGFAEEMRSAAHSKELIIPVQQLYREWGNSTNLSSARLDRIRRFFNQQNLRNRMKPLEAAIVSGGQIFPAVSTLIDPEPRRRTISMPKKPGKH